MTVKFSALILCLIILLSACTQKVGGSVDGQKLFPNDHDDPNDTQPSISGKPGGADDTTQGEVVDLGDDNKSFGDNSPSIQSEGSTSQALDENGVAWYSNN